MKKFICRNTYRRSAGGFSMVELLVVLAIIGILAAVAGPAYMDRIANARASELLLQYDAARTKAAIAANGAGVNLCQTVKSSGLKLSDPKFDELLDRLAPASIATPYFPLVRDLGHGASDDGLALLLSVEVHSDPMLIAIARNLYRHIANAGMAAPGAVVTDSEVAFAAYLAERPCDTTLIVAAQNKAAAALGLPTGGQPAQPAQPAQVASQPPATQQSGPPPRPTEKAIANVCSGRLCAITAEEQECPVELVEYRPPSPDGQGGVEGNDWVGPVGPGTPTDSQRWVAFAIITIADDTDGQRSVTKRCSTYAETKSLWWDQTSDNNGGCMDIFHDELAPNGQAVTCHYGTTILPGQDARNLQRTSGLFPRSAEIDPATIVVPPEYVPINPDDPMAEENMEDPANPDSPYYQAPYVPEPKRKEVFVNFP